MLFEEVETIATLEVQYNGAERPTMLKIEEDENSAIIALTPSQTQALICKLEEHLLKAEMEAGGDLPY